MKSSEIMIVQAKEGYIVEVRHGKILWEAKRKCDFDDVDDDDNDGFWWAWESDESDIIFLMLMKNWYRIAIIYEHVDSSFKKQL